MIFYKESNENEMILNFLQCEFKSDRFSAELLSIMKEKNIGENIICNANLDDVYENNKRKELLGEYRGYGKNLKLFENFPKILSYKLVLLEQDDLNNIRYINYSYWNKLSNGSFSPIEACKNIENGIEIYNVSNKPFIDGAKKLIDGEEFLPCILLTSNYKKYIILEGHSRMTIYGLIKDKFVNVKAYVLECNEEELKLWNDGII